MPRARPARARPPGKARVARNPIKHGFFVAQEKWTPGQHRDFARDTRGTSQRIQTAKLRWRRVASRTIAQSYVRMAAMLRYENIAALEHHLAVRIANWTRKSRAAKPPSGCERRAQREKLRRAGLWQPTIPGPREARAIIRYSGSLERTIRSASARVCETLKICDRRGDSRRGAKSAKTNPLPASPKSGLRPREGPRTACSRDEKCEGHRLA